MVVIVVRSPEEQVWIRCGSGVDSPPYSLSLFIHPPGCVDWQQEVVGAQAVALGVGVAEDASLQQLVLRVGDA